MPTFEDYQKQTHAEILSGKWNNYYQRREQKKYLEKQGLAERRKEAQDRQLRMVSAQGSLWKNSSYDRLSMVTCHSAFEGVAEEHGHRVCEALPASA